MPSVADNAIQTIDQDNEELASLLANSTPSGGKETAADKKAAQQQEANQKALQSQISAVTNSPWTKLSSALTQQYEQAQTPTAALVSGSEGSTAQQGAAGQALASLGLSPSSSAGSWLESQTAAAQETAAPVAQAMAQEGAQYAAETKPIESALAATGQANALETQTAPDSSWLNALASHVQSNLSYYGLVPTASLSSLSPGVAEALKLSGGYGGTAGSGTTPIQNVQADPSTGGSKVKTNTGAGGALASAGSTGVVPTPSAAPGG